MRLIRRLVLPRVYRPLPLSSVATLVPGRATGCRPGRLRIRLPPWWEGGREGGRGVKEREPVKEKERERPEKGEGRERES